MSDDLELLHHRDLRRIGASPRAAVRRMNAGELVRVRRGTYAEREPWAESTAESRMLARVHAAQAAARGPLVFCAESAAVVLRIPLSGALPTRPHVLVPPGSAKSNHAVRRTHRAAEAFTTVVGNGVLVTDAVTTAIDLAAARGVLGGAIAISHVLHSGLALREEFEDRVASARPFRGVARAERALRLASEHSESPLESLVLVRCDDLGFARPEQQLIVPTSLGDFRVDFAWDGGRRVLEADGRAKYEDTELLGGRRGADALWAEKRREDALRESVDAFGRVSWPDAFAGHGLERVLLHLGIPRIARRRMLTP